MKKLGSHELFSSTNYRHVIPDEHEALRKSWAQVMRTHELFSSTNYRHLMNTKLCEEAGLKTAATGEAYLVVALFSSV